MLKFTLKWIFFSVVTIGITYSQAQECNTYFPTEEGTSFELSSYNKKGKLQSVAIYEVESKDKTDEGLLIEMDMTLVDDKGKELQNSGYEARCKDDVYYIDVTAMMNPELTEGFRNMDITIDGKEMALPGNLSVGQSLPDANTEIKVESAGLSLMSFNFNVTDRKVEAKEELTTPAGTFPCYKLSYTLDVKMGLKKTMKIKEWYAKEVGLVRSETYNKKDKLTGYTELTSFERP